MMPHRVKILDQAAIITGTDRNKSYGNPVTNLGDCAELWAAYLSGKYAGKTAGFENTIGEFRLSAEDVAWMNVLQKIARTYKAYTPDNYIDASAYAAIAGECAHEETLNHDE